MLYYEPNFLIVDIVSMYVAKKKKKLPCLVVWFTKKNLVINYPESNSIFFSKWRKI